MVYGGTGRDCFLWPSGTAKYWDEPQTNAGFSRSATVPYSQHLHFLQRSCIICILMLAAQHGSCSWMAVASVGWLQCCVRNVRSNGYTSGPQAWRRDWYFGSLGRPMQASPPPANSCTRSQDERHCCRATPRTDRIFDGLPSCTVGDDVWPLCYSFGGRSIMSRLALVGPSLSVPCSLVRWSLAASDAQTQNEQAFTKTIAVVNIVHTRQIETMHVKKETTKESTQWEQTETKHYSGSLKLNPLCWHWRCCCDAHGLPWATLVQAPVLIGALLFDFAICVSPRYAFQVEISHQHRCQGTPVGVSHHSPRSSTRPHWRPLLSVSSFKSLTHPSVGTALRSVQLLRTRSRCGVAPFLWPSLHSCLLPLPMSIFAGLPVSFGSVHGCQSPIAFSWRRTLPLVTHRSSLVPLLLSVLCLSSFLRLNSCAQGSASFRTELVSLPPSPASSARSDVTSWSFNQELDSRHCWYYS